MGKIIDTNYNKIIICLIAFIFMLLFLISQNKESVKQDTDSINIGQIDRQNLNNFLTKLQDRKQKVHGVQFLSTNNDGELVLFDDNLNEIKPCFEDPRQIIKKLDLETNNLHVTIPPIPQECLNSNGIVLQPDLEKRQLVILTPVKSSDLDISKGENQNMKDNKSISRLIITSGDPKHRVLKKYCPPDGDC